MRPNRLPLLTALLSALIITSALPGLCLGMKYKTAGSYTDAAGAQHAWTLDGNHTLIWDGEPYIPVGGVFVPKSTTAGATEDTFSADTKALDEFKAKGITDIILKSGGPITATNPAAWQKIISYLDSNGFTYGVEMDDGPKDALKGYIIAPHIYKIEGPNPETNITCNITGVDSAIYVVLKRFDNTIKYTGGAVVKDGKVTVRLPEPLESGEMLFVYPRKAYKTTAEGGVGDIWSGFGEYRDRVLEFSKGIKFGKGLRFFFEPFTCKNDFAGDMGGFIPDSSGFRLGFEAYLSKKYPHEGAVNTDWAMNDILGSIEQAARLTPLWIAGRGAPFFYDKMTAKLHSADPSSTKFWNDLLEYRDTSAQGFMNTIADTLKRQVADVPVIFKCSNYHGVYATPFGIGGMDGLAAVVTDTGDTSIASAAGSTYSLTEECGKTTWCVADTSASAGFGTENALTGSLGLLQEAGCKGFFVGGLVDNPSMIDWLGKFKGTIKSSLAAFRPDIIYFPSVPQTGAYIKRLALNTWWLPSLRLGKSSYIGDGMSAYTIAGEDRSYLWSSSGDIALTFKTPPTGMPVLEYPRNEKISGKKGGKFSVALTANPTVLKGADINLLFPFETANAEIMRLAEIIPQADKFGLDVKQARATLEQAKTVLSNGQYFVAYGMSQMAIQNLQSLIGADLWVEAELSNLSNFGTAIAVPGASEGVALVLDTADEPPLSSYTAYCRFNTSSNSSYEIWIAGTPLAEASPIAYAIDDGAWTPVTASGASPETYTPGLAWYKIGAANLFPGNHTLKLRVTGKRSKDNRYYFTFDAAALSTKGFKPNGIKKPF